MQTFLPYPDFEESIRCLDYRRLGKQRVEAKQILNILLERTIIKGWRNHPAVLMWKHYEESLKLYMNTCIKEWIKQGYRNTMELEEVSYIEYPYWLGNEEFHASHRSNLLRKDNKYYSQFNWKEPADLEYIWPKAKDLNFK